VNAYVASVEDVLMDSLGAALLASLVIDKTLWSFQARPAIFHQDMGAVFQSLSCTHW